MQILSHRNWEIMQLGARNERAACNDSLPLVQLSCSSRVCPLCDLTKANLCSVTFYIHLHRQEADAAVIDLFFFSVVFPVSNPLYL